MKNNDIILLEQAYQHMQKLKAHELQRDMQTNNDLEQQPLGGPFAIVYHGQSHEWYGNGDPKHRKGRYKQKGDCGKVLAINIATREQAEAVLEEMEAEMESEDWGEWGVDWSLCRPDSPEIVSMENLPEHFFEYDPALLERDPYMKPADVHHRKWFKDFGATEDYHDQEMHESHSHSEDGTCQHAQNGCDCDDCSACRENQNNITEDIGGTKTDGDWVRWVKSKYPNKWQFVTVKDKHIIEFEQEEGALAPEKKELIMKIVGRKFKDIILKKPQPYDNSRDWGDDDRDKERWNSSTSRARRSGYRPNHRGDWK